MAVIVQGTLPMPLRSCRSLCAALIVGMAAGLAVTPAIPAPIVAGFERFGRQTDNAIDRIEAGLLLLGELGCVNCHRAGAAEAHVSAKAGPILDRVGERIDPAWIATYLRDPAAAHPGTTMPQVLANLDEGARALTSQAIAHYLAATGEFSRGSFPGAQDARPRDGVPIYDRVGCRACHGDRLSTAPHLPDQRPLGDLAAKWSPTALDAFLQNPLHTRPSSRMPAFPLDDGDRRHLVAALLLPESRWGGVAEQTVAFGAKSWNQAFGSLPDFATLGKPDRTGPLQGFDVEGFAGRTDGFCVQLTGFFHASAKGRYRFDLASDDGSRLLVGGATVIDNDGVHPHSWRSGDIELDAGIHEIAVEFFESAGQCSLELDVAPPGASRESALAFITPSRDGKPARTARPAPPPFKVDAGLVAEGKQAFAAHGCANCHRLDGAESVALKMADLPPLNTLAGKAGAGDIAGCVGQKPAAKGSPLYGLDNAQREAIGAALAFLASPAAAEAPARERAISRSVTSLNCLACHVRDGKGGAIPAVAILDDDGEPILKDPARDALFTGPIPEMGEEGRLPPTLDGVGDKLRREFLDEVLANGGVDRRATMHTLMPKWHGEVAKPLTALLADDPKTDIRIPAIAGHAEAEIVDKGRDLIGSKGLGCIKCHAFAGDRGQGLGAIDMTRFPKRLRHEWYLAYVENPQRFRPGTRMPAAWPEGKVFYPDILSGDAGNQIESVWRYVSLAKPRPPVGLGNDPIELVATDKPVIYRNFIEGAGPRAIGIGFPERVNIAWDAEAFRLALAWKGSFIDARRHWSGRGEGFQPPMGDAVFNPDAGPCVAILPAIDAPWPAEPVRKRGGRFGGYALDDKGRPTFRWSLPAEKIAVRESIGGDSVGNPLLKRAVTVERQPNAAGLEGLVFRAAVADSIEAEPDGWWRVAGFWRVRVLGEGVGPGTVVTIDGKKELRYSVTPPVETATAARVTFQEELSW